MSKKPFSPWPYVISGMIVIGIIAGGWTIKIALDNPVQIDNSFMQNRWALNQNINKILEDQILFDREYNAEYISRDVKKDNAKVVFKVLKKDGTAVENAVFDLLLTRPETVELDIKLTKPTQAKNGIYSFENISLPKEGRWNIFAKISIDDKIGYITLKTDTFNNFVTDF